MHRAGRASTLALAALVLCVSGLCVPAAFGATRFDDVSISVQAPPPGVENRHGYLEYRISITNHSAKDAHAVKLLFPMEGSSSGGDRLRRISRSVKVAPSSTVRVSLLHPSLPIWGGGLGVVIDGRTQPDGVFLSGGSGGSRRHSGGSEQTVLLSRTVDNDFEDAFNAVTASAGSGRSYSSGTGVTFAKSGSDPAEWSTNWLGYSCYDGIVVTNEDMATMPQPVLGALWQYVECGGSLLVLGAADVPKALRTRMEREEGFEVYYAGFGQCIVAPEADFTGWNKVKWQPIRRSWSRTFSPFRTVASIENANSAFPVVEGLAVPVRGLLVLMLVFVVVIGPLNLWVLARKKKRIWMLWTVPVISLLTCGAVTLYAAIGEGWRGRFRTRTLTFLDQTTHRATTIGWVAFYSPVTPGGGLHFGYETELTAQVGDPSSRYGGYGHGYPRRDNRGRARDIDWTNDQHLGAGWVTARVPAHFQVRKSETRRERLTVTRSSDGTLTAVNGLGARISVVVFADEEGRIYSASNIAPGAQAELAPAKDSRRAVGYAAVLRSVFTSDWLPSIDRLKQRPREYLTPNSYIACVDETLFVEQALKKADPMECQSVVYGLVGEITNGN